VVRNLLLSNFFGGLAFIIFGLVGQSFDLIELCVGFTKKLPRLSEIKVDWWGFEAIVSKPQI
jgi:hypothetical protein